MGQKLATQKPLESTPVVNVRGEVGQFMIGKYLGMKTVAMSFGPKNVYEFAIQESTMPILRKEGKEYVETDVKKGGKVAVFASTRLNYALEQATVGQVLKITYLGLGKKPKRGGNAPHEHEVEIQ